MCFNPNGFDFPTLWTITQRYFDQCPHGPWLFLPHDQTELSPQEASLTLAAAISIVGAGWKVYNASDIWYRLTTWKFPLWQLVANSPRPPLGLSVECFSIFHLLGNPIGSIRDLLRKLHDCQARAEYWRGQLNDPLQSTARLLSPALRASLVKKLAIIFDSYAEYGEHIRDAATQALTAELARPLRNEEDRIQRRQILHLCRENANSLAADRSTEFFPITVAQGFFIANVIIAIIRTKSLTSGPNPATFINIEVYSVGFSALYFWIIFAVFLSSVIGASQTASAIPRILGRLREELIATTDRRLATMPEILNESARLRNGGIYSWQPGRRADRTLAWAPSQLSWALNLRKSPSIRYTSLRPYFRASSWAIFPYLSVTLAAFTGWMISYLVPPVGWGCRNYGELIIYLIWLFSALIEDLISFGNCYRAEFWIILAKDFLCMGATTGMVIAIQLGIYDSPKCYTLGGRTGLALPGMPSVAATLSHNLDTVYPALAAVGIGIQLVIFPGIVLWRYRTAMRVFLQRDDERSNLPMPRRWVG